MRSILYKIRVLPLWLWLLLASLALILCLSGTGMFTLYTVQRSQAEQTAVAQLALLTVEMATAQFEEALAAQQTTESENASASQATFDASTAEAQGDDDGDGLSNNHEHTLGTDPNNSDTDGDGLNDGQEVNQYGTSPVQQDTDGDTLSDGAEVNEYVTSPVNPDTDADGMSDGIEVNEGSDPLAVPIETAMPTFRPTNTETPTSTLLPTVILGPTPDTQLGNIVYDVPESMFIEQPVEIILLVKPAVGPTEQQLENEIGELEADLVEELGEIEQQPSRIITATVKATNLMRATLTSTDPDAFNIQALHSSEVQPLSSDENTKWEWSVLPLKDGEQRLLLVVSRKYDDPEGEVFWREVESYRKSIAVKVTFAKRLADVGEEIWDLKWWIGGILFPILTALAVREIQRRQNAAETNGRADGDPRKHYSMRSSTASYVKLHDAIDRQFSDDEVQSLCFEMGIEYANLPARTKTNRVWELIAYCERSDQIMILLELCKMERPATDWDSLV